MDSWIHTHMHSPHCCICIIICKTKEKSDGCVPCMSWCYYLLRGPCYARQIYALIWSSVQKSHWKNVWTSSRSLNDANIFLGFDNGLHLVCYTLIYSRLLHDSWLRSLLLSTTKFPFSSLVPKQHEWMGKKQNSDV
jgi:hypothetical protein